MTRSSATKSQPLRATRSRARKPAKSSGWLRWSLAAAAATTQNLMPPLLQASHARASVGEIMKALADVFGRYEQKSA